MSVTVIYALTSNGDDVYAQMTLASVQSARLFFSRSSVRVFVDAKSLEVGRKPIRERFGDIAIVQSVPTPAGPPAFRNRFMKTRLRELCDGDFVYLDGDTLMRGDISDAFAVPFDVAVVANHNDLAMRVPEQEAATMHHCGWPVPEGPYYNAGVQFWADNAATRHAGKLYHEAWLVSVGQLGRPNDQYAFNHAMHAAALRIEMLPSAYNAQINSCMAAAFDAKVWHFFFSEEERVAVPRTVFGKLLTAERMPRDFSTIVKRSHPWIVSDPIGALMIHRARKDWSYLAPNDRRRLWLAGQRLSVLSRIGHALARRVPVPMRRLLKLGARVIRLRA